MPLARTHVSHDRATKWELRSGRLPRNLRPAQGRPLHSGRGRPQDAAGSHLKPLPQRTQPASAVRPTKRPSPLPGSSSASHSNPCSRLLRNERCRASKKVNQCRIHYMDGTIYLSHECFETESTHKAEAQSWGGS